MAILKRVVTNQLCLCYHSKAHHDPAVIFCLVGSTALLQQRCALNSIPLHCRLSCFMHFADKELHCLTVPVFGAWDLFQTSLFQTESCTTHNQRNHVCITQGLQMRWFSVYEEVWKFSKIIKGKKMYVSHKGFINHIPEHYFLLWTFWLAIPNMHNDTIG